MSKVDRYLQAATREHTRRSYQSAVEHFEVAWGGVLPTTATELARYLAHYADTLAITTLKQRLAALSSWHQAQGFADPTKAPLVRQVLKGIRELHPDKAKQAKPLQLNVLEQIIGYLDQQALQAQQTENYAKHLRAVRDKALVLMGFWRAFRSDELSRLHIEHLEFVPGEGMIAYLPRSKTDRTNQGQAFRLPELQRLCPVDACRQYLVLLQQAAGPLFRAVNRWGMVSESSLRADSIIPLLRHLLQQAQVDDAALYSSHSLRRGFANWANQQGWSLKQLMEHVGWRDVKSAMRYLESNDPFSQQAIDQALALPAPSQVQNQLKTHVLELRLHLQPYHQRGRSSTARQHIERYCLKPYAMSKGSQQESYLLTMHARDHEELDGIVDDLLLQLHDAARAHQCMVEITLKEQATGQQWD